MHSLMIAHLYVQPLAIKYLSRDKEANAPNPRVVVQSHPKGLFILVEKRGKNEQWLL